MDKDDLDLLLEIYDVLGNYADVVDREGNYGITQAPNDAMRMQGELREVLLKYGVDVDQ